MPVAGKLHTTLAQINLAMYSLWNLLVSGLMRACWLAPFNSGGKSLDINLITEYGWAIKALAVVCFIAGFTLLAQGAVLIVDRLAQPQAEHYFSWGSATLCATVGTAIATGSLAVIYFL